jgi:hypothetical protein
MRKNWLLPEEKMFTYTVPDWLLLLLCELDEMMKAKVLLLLWRAWHLQNDVIHGKGTESIKGFVSFLVSYGESLEIASYGTLASGAGDKEKAKMFPESKEGRSDPRKRKDSTMSPEKWKPPPPGWVKLNTDAGFCASSSMAGTSAVVRDSKGKVLLTAWQFLRHCGSPEEAEACLQGLRLVLEWIKHPTCIEADCLSLIKALETSHAPRSGWAGVIEEIQAARNLLPGSTISHARREVNKVAHELAQRAMKNQECEVMRQHAPECVRRQIVIKANGRMRASRACNSLICD